MEPEDELYQKQPSKLLARLLVCEWQTHWFMRQNCFAMSSNALFLIPFRDKRLKHATSYRRLIFANQQATIVRGEQSLYYSDEPTIQVIKNKKKFSYLEVYYKQNSVVVDHLNFCQD